jgi:hypothetical protein
MMIYQQSFDLFSGTVDSAPMWLESVRGLDSALVRMRERAEGTPGPYFVFDSSSQTVMGLIDTASSDGAAKGPIHL